MDLNILRKNSNLVIVLDFKEVACDIPSIMILGVFVKSGYGFR